MTETPIADGPGAQGRVWDAWLAATRQELAAPAEALVHGSDVLRSSLPAGAPPRFVEAVTNIHTRSQQMQEWIARWLHIDGTSDLDENQEKTLRHDLRGYAAYVIGMCRLWQQQAPKFRMERVLPPLENLAATAGPIVPLLG